MVKIKPTDKACQRTKNRIREYGPNLEMIKRGIGRHCFPGREITLFSTHDLKSLSDEEHEDSWMGWIPDDEWEFAEFEE